MAAFKLSDEAEDCIESLLSRYATNCRSMRDNLFGGMEYTDRCIQRESNRSQEYLAGRLAQRMGKKRTLGEIEIPTTFSQVDTAHARLVGMFLTGSPIFGCTSEDPVLEDFAQQLNALSKRDQNTFSYVPQLMLFLADALKYRHCALEVEYATIYKNTVATAAGANDSNSALTSVAIRGNRIKRVDPYNLFYDPSVPLTQVHELGAYGGYIERLNYINTKLFLQECNPEFLIKKNISSVLSSSCQPQESLYKRPDVEQVLGSQKAVEYDWGVFWGQTARNNAVQGHTGIFEKVVVYAKLIPDEFKLRMDRGGTPAIFKLVWINSELIYCEPLRNAHGKLPLIVGCGYDNGLGLQSKSMAEQLTDFQEVLNALVNSTFVAMRRAVSDRALFDPQRIRVSDLDSANPAAKIPVRLNQFNKSLSDAYHPIPFEDRITPYFMQNFGVLQGVSQQITGLNPAAQGAFVKGNKTKTEYSDVQSNSDARTQKFALNLEYTTFTPVKYLMKMNYLQYATNEELVDQTSGQAVKVDIIELRKRDMDFDITDGLNPASKIVPPDIITAAIQTIPQMPELNVEYSAGAMLVHMLKSQGLNLAKYKRSPAEIKQMQQQQLALAQAQAGQQPQQQVPPQ